MKSKTDLGITTMRRMCFHQILSIKKELYKAFNKHIPKEGHGQRNLGPLHVNHHLDVAEEDVDSTAIRHLYSLTHTQVRP